MSETNTNEAVFSADFADQSKTVSELINSQINNSYSVIGYFKTARLVDSVQDGETIEPNIHASQFETQEQKLRRLEQNSGTNFPAVDSQNSYDELLALTKGLIEGESTPDEQLAEWLQNPERFFSLILLYSTQIRTGLEHRIKDGVHPSTGDSLYFKTGESEATKVTWFNRFGQNPEAVERGDMSRAQWARYRIARKLVDNPIVRILSYDIDMQQKVERVTASGLTINPDGLILPIKAVGYPLAKNAEGNWAFPYISIIEPSVVPDNNGDSRIERAKISTKGIGQKKVSDAQTSEVVDRTIETLKQITPDKSLLSIPMGRMVTRGELKSSLSVMTPESFLDIERATAAVAANYRYQFSR